jgi:hypothetical protein
MPDVVLSLRMPVRVAVHLARRRQHKSRPTTLRELQTVLGAERPARSVSMGNRWYASGDAAEARWKTTSTGPTSGNGAVTSC